MLLYTYKNIDDLFCVFRIIKHYIYYFSSIIWICQKNVVSLQEI